MSLKLGCDPEAFLIDLEGQFRSSIDKVGGTKLNPQPLPLGDGYAVQEDNVAIEFNIPPAESRAAFVASIRDTLNYLIGFVGNVHGLTVSPVSAASFPDEELQDLRALEFGCDPDFNAWTKDVNPKPSAADKNLRSCGGHVHIGFDNQGVDKFDVIKYMDLFTGVPSVLMDKGEMRKELYGKAGACRIKSYGAEYRTLSNFWIFDNRLIEWVWDNTSRAVAAAESRLAISEEDSTDIVNAINNNDKQLAQKLVNKFNLEVVNV